MNWIQQNKPVVIAGVAMLLILIVMCSALAITITQTNILAPTITPAPLTEEQYIDKYNQWNKQGYQIMVTIVAILRGDTISKEVAENAGAQLAYLKADVESTLPPSRYVEAHTHYTQAIQDVYDATIAMNEGRTKEAAAKFNHATTELDVVKALMKVA